MIGLFYTEEGNQLILCAVFTLVVERKQIYFSILN